MIRELAVKLRDFILGFQNNFITPSKSPDELLGELFQDVQLLRVYPDGITFVDLVPDEKLGKIVEAYKKERQRSDFDLHKFVKRHFKHYIESSVVYTSNKNHTIEQHIEELWSVLTRRTYRNKGSLIALPNKYVVPGGRFASQFYWDSYFTMLGLAASEKWELVEGMIKNCSYMIRKVGFVPSANRTYFLSRSQPPFFSEMVKLLAKKEGKLVFLRYLPHMFAEHRFWMKGTKDLLRYGPATKRVVLMPNGTVLNRYFDDRQTPRPEMYREDVDATLLSHDRLPSKVYVDIRAAAESGWDFSSRWFKDGLELKTIRTTDIVPIDLNCLMFLMEQTISKTYLIFKHKGLSRYYQRLSEERAATIQKYLWNQKRGWFYDYDFGAKEQTESMNLAGAFALYAQIATKEQAGIMAKTIQKHFLKPGGVVTTLKTTGQQWDAPNGWAPLQWITIQGLRNYGHNELADEIKKRWMTNNKKIYKEHKKIVEKYNVVDPSMSAGGGEYALQDGFGWTNSVYMALLKEFKR